MKIRSAFAFFLVALTSSCSFKNEWTPSRSLPETAQQRQSWITGRTYLSSALTQIFGPSVQSDVDALVTSQVGPFGGEPCDPNSSDGCPVRGFSQLEMIPSLTAQRYGLKTRICQRIVIRDEALLFALKQATGQQALINFPDINQASITAVLGLFYEGDPIPNSVTAALSDLAKAAVTEGGSAADSWRMIFDAICESPFWELL